MEWEMSRNMTNCHQSAERFEGGRWLKYDLKIFILCMEMHKGVINLVTVCKWTIVTPKTRKQANFGQINVHVMIRAHCHSPKYVNPALCLSTLVSQDSKGTRLGTYAQPADKRRLEFDVTMTWNASHNCTMI